METSLRVYTKEPYDAAEGSGSNGWDTLAKRWSKATLMAGGPEVGIDAMQREVYKSVHWWRGRVAREEDESTRWVAPLPFLGLHWSSFFFFGFDRFVLQKLRSLPVCGAISCRYRCAVGYIQVL